MAAYFKMSRTIARPAGEAFATAVRLDEFPRWSPRNPWAKKLTAGEIKGTQFQMGIKGFGKITNELREFQANKQVMVVPLINMFDGGHSWIFTDLGDGSTRIDHELDMRRAPGSGWVLCPQPTWRVSRKRMPDIRASGQGR